MTIYETREGVRLILNREKQGHWNRWGPYLSERAWGTVREDYSASGDAWSYFPHDQARSRTYRWNEDGLGGICDREQFLCFALALWNGKDPILKERMFGVTGMEGNHGEDAKDYWYYLDSTPSHAYMKYLYKYAQAEFPYARLIEENRHRGKHEPEFELVDTGIFDEGRYFDVQIEYAKVQAEDILIRISVSNRGPEAATLQVLPTLWFRNTWSWGWDDRRPTLHAAAPPAGTDPAVRCIRASHFDLGEYILYCDGAEELLFTENETNCERIFGTPSATPYVKDALHAYVVEGQRDAVNPAHQGTKAAARYALTVPAGATTVLRLRLAALRDLHPLSQPFADFDIQVDGLIEEADEFYAAVLPSVLGADARLVARQAFAGMLWSKQFYHYVVEDWLNGDPGQPPPSPERKRGRNHDWPHLFNRDVISMPDKWEFPWYAAWDLGFHCVALAHIDPGFAKEQLILMLREWYMHPDGRIPAYEWNFDDVNPPVLSMAAMRVFEIDRKLSGVADYAFLERVFQKLLLNFTWWVNRKDVLGNNVFEGGFLGMDNIGALDRDNLPPGYMLGQADGSSWMAAFAKSMQSIALVLATQNPVYEDLASKFWEHLVFIANSINSKHDPERSLWNEEDGFFYDHLIDSEGNRTPVRARTMVGFVPMFGATVAAADLFDHFPSFKQRQDWFISHRPHLIDTVAPMLTPGASGDVLLGLVREDQLRRMLHFMLDEDEFLSPYGVRAVSRYHADHPVAIALGDQEYQLDYEPGESTTDLFGGNSNWRGPIWMPVNFMILAALHAYARYFGPDFTVEFPTGSGRQANLEQVTNELALRLMRIFLRNAEGRRPVHGDNDLFHRDPYWRDLIPFHEYFHGDTGRGCGASHQTGWTGLIAELMIVAAETFPNLPGRQSGDASDTHHPPTKETSA